MLPSQLPSLLLRSRRVRQPVRAVEELAPSLEETASFIGKDESDVSLGFGTEGLEFFGRLVGRSLHNVPWPGSGLPNRGESSTCEPLFLSRGRALVGRCRNESFFRLSRTSTLAEVAYDPAEGWQGQGPMEKAALMWVFSLG